jgi:hypothetical protein
MANYRSDLIDINLEYRHHTEKAILVFDGDTEVWLPLSLCEVNPYNLDTLSRGQTITVTLRESFAIEKGLV